MSELLITCPACGHRFPVSDALRSHIHAEVESDVRAQFERRLNRAAKEAEARAREAAALELQDLRAQLDEQRRLAEQARQQELALRKQAREIEDRRRQLDLELERRLAAERASLEKTLRAQIEETQTLKLREKEKQIADLRQALDDARRKSQQGSQELQGEVLELDLEARLREQFPHDDIQPVPKGMRGADLVQEVRNPAGQSCGSIVWETKNTRHFQPAWLDKLKQDQRAVGASLAVLVSAALPAEVRDFARIDGVWVVSLGVWPALAVALREQLVQVAFARAASQGRQDKMALLYRYLSGDEFRHRVEAIVEAFSALHGQLHQERRAMERLWREREKQLDRIILNTAGMYGDLRGLIGTTLPEIPALALESAAGLLQEDPR